MTTLYLAEQGAVLKKSGDTFQVTRDDKELASVPAQQVDQVVIFGNVHLTTPVIHFLLYKGIDCVFCSSTGAYHGRLISTESNFGYLRQAQALFCRDAAACLPIGMAMARAKLRNCRTLLMRNARDHPDLHMSVEGLVHAMDASIEQMARAADSLSLLGLEGVAAVNYFSGFRGLLKQDLGFEHRNRRPPRDPVNSMLSFGYTLLTYAGQHAVRVAGLDPFMGVLHSTEYSKPSLALDLIEEFRPILVDSVVLTVVNTGAVKPEDFGKSEERAGMVRLKEPAMKAFIAAFERRLATEVEHPLEKGQTAYRRCLELQARQLARIFLGKQREYVPFLVR